MTMFDLILNSDLDYKELYIELFDLVDMCHRDMFKRNPQLFEDPNSKYFATIDDIRKFVRDNHGETEIW